MIKKAIAFFFLLIIVWIGINLRINKIMENLWWIDGARDVYVARKMHEEGKFLFIAPAAGGGGGLIGNSPLYYWILKTVWEIMPTPEGIVFFFTLIGIFTILLSYFLGKTFLNSIIAGLMITALVSFNFIFILYSRQVFQPHLIPLIVTIILLALFLAIKKKSYIWMSVACLAYFIGVNIHYSILMIAPAFLFWFFSFIYKNLKINSKKSLFLNLLLIIEATILFITWQILILKTGSRNFFDYLFFQLKIDTISSNYPYSPVLLLDYLFAYSEGLINNRNFLFILPICKITEQAWIIFKYIIYLSIPIALLRIYYVRNKIYFSYLFVASFYLCSLFFFIFKNPYQSSSVELFYFAPFLIILMLAITQILYFLFSKNMVWGLIYLLILLFSSKKVVVNDWKDSLEYNGVAHLSQVLFNYHQETFGDFTPFYIFTHTNRHSPMVAEAAYVDSIERQFSLNISKLKTDGYNISQKESNNSANYLICDQYSIDSDIEASRVDCFTQISKHQNFEILSYKSILVQPWSSIYSIEIVKDS